MTRRIIWQHWTHPLGGGPEWKTEGQTFEHEDDDREEVRPLLLTSSGLVPITVYKNAFRHVNFWMCHTNFDVDKHVRKIVKEVPGVEVLDVLTRYRMRIGFGKLFRSATIKSEIQRELRAMSRPNERNPGGMVLDDETRSRLAEAERYSRDNFRYWAHLVLPNGRIESLNSADLRDYRTNLKVLVEAQELAGGILLTHDPE